MASVTNTGFLDYETKSKEDIGNGAAKYASHESTDLVLISYAIEDEDAECYHIDDVLKEPQLMKRWFEFMSDGGDLVAHNMLFEIFITKFVSRPRYQWPRTQLTQWLDTMHMAGRAGLPMGLGDCAKALRITEKLEEGKDLIARYCVPTKTGGFNDILQNARDLARFKEYCATDVVVSREIYKNLPAYKPTEREDIVLDLRANLHGVPVDYELAGKILENVEKEQAGFAERATKLTNGVITKMTQVQRLKKWVQAEMGTQVPCCAADYIVEILDGKHGEVSDVTRELLEMRQHSGKASTGKYKRFRDSHVDGIILGMIISFGTHTHRTISRLLNLNNLPKPSVKYDNMDVLIKDLRELDVGDINEKYGSYLKAASTAIRGLIRPLPGKVLCVADYSSIEARLVFWLADCIQGLQKYHDGIDNYIDMAAFIYGKHYDDIDEDERWVGKNVILGAGFGLGWKGFQNTCANYGRVIADNLCKQAINSYRENYPEVVEAWAELEDGAMLACRTGKVVECLKGKIAFKTMKTKSGVTFLLMRVPNGTFMMFPDVKIVMTKLPWGERKKAVSYLKVTDGRLQRETTYGGKWMENAAQKIARDVMYNGAKEAYKENYEMLFAVYDEAITLHDEDSADLDVFCRALCKPADWMAGMPIEAEGKIVKTYRKI